MLACRSYLTDQEESPETAGLGVIPGMVRKFNDSTKSVPQIGWNSATQSTTQTQSSSVSGPLVFPVKQVDTTLFYLICCTIYRKFRYSGLGSILLQKYNDVVSLVSSVWKDNVFATQNSILKRVGPVALHFLKAFIESPVFSSDKSTASVATFTSPTAYLQPKDIADGSTVRVIACLDVRANDQGDLVVTKVDQYDVRESAEQGGNVRNSR